MGSGRWYRPLVAPCHESVEYLYLTRSNALKVVGDPLDDVYDSARYGLCSFVTAAAKPIEVRQAELTAQFAERLHGLPYSERSAVITSAAIRHGQLKTEEEARGRPTIR